MTSVAVCGPFWTKSIETTGGRIKPYSVATSFSESDLWRDLKIEFEPIPSDPIARRLVRPSTLFAWGVYQPHGWAVLVGSTAVSLVAFSGCVLIVRRAALQVGYPRAGLALGLVALCPLVGWCGDSVSLQLTSVNATRAHRDAVVVLVGTVLAVGVVAGVIELVTQARRSSAYAASRHPRYDCTHLAPTA